MENIINNTDLKWLFISGKGGVGKTTISSAMGIELSKHREDVLIISTDPAHSLSDIFTQTFTYYPNIVNGYSNLYCMEYDQSHYDDKLNIHTDSPYSFMTDLFKDIPGIDEALGYLSLMKKVMEMNYSIIIFDTAPTGHTLKLLSYPHTLKESYTKILNSSVGNMFKQMISNIINPSTSIENSIDKVITRIDTIHTLFTNPQHTQFICVCIPEYLPVYETERLIQKILLYNIECNTIIINKIIETDFLKQTDKCLLCKSRQDIQTKYLDIIDELYSEDFTIIYTPQLETDIQNKHTLETFTTTLYNTVEYQDECI